MICKDCPRQCGVDRSQKVGFCREGENVRIAKIIENFMWEEPCLTGEKGALAIFFSGCNLRCKFCQNYEISHIGKGKTYTPQEFLELLNSFDLNKFSCIDLISPTQFSSALATALKNFKSPVPIVWNSNGYERVETIRRVAEFIDIFLADLKYFDGDLAYSLSSAKDYFDYASKAIVEMAALKPNIFDGEIMKQGLVIRHLILPGQTKDSIKILDYIKANIPQPFVSIMSQFTPIPQSPIKRKLLPLEAKAVIAHAQKIGLNNGYAQDLDSANDNFIPNF